MKRTGRRGHPQYRVVVQDSHFSPSSGRVVAFLGSYNPHTKQAKLDADAARKFLDNGAQPSDRVARLLQSEGIELPKWVKFSAEKSRKIRSPEKLRRNHPKEVPADTADAVETPSEDTAAEENTEEAQPKEDATAEPAEISAEPAAADDVKNEA